MKKTLQLLIKIDVLILALSIIELCLYLSNNKTWYFVTLIVALSGLVICLILTAYMVIEQRKVLFEYHKDGLEIRLLKYEDYQTVRALLDTTPLTNSKEEVTLLHNYEETTEKLVKEDYHYLVVLDNKPVAIFYNKKNTDKVIFLNKLEEKENLKNILIELGKRSNKTIDFD